MVEPSTAAVSAASAAADTWVRLRSILRGRSSAGGPVPDVEGCWAVMISRVIADYCAAARLGGLLLSTHGIPGLLPGSTSVSGATPDRSNVPRARPGLRGARQWSMVRGWRRPGWPPGKARSSTTPLTATHAATSGQLNATRAPPTTDVPRGGPVGSEARCSDRAWGGSLMWIREQTGHAVR